MQRTMECTEERLLELFNFLEICFGRWEWKVEILSDIPEPGNNTDLGKWKEMEISQTEGGLDVFSHGKIYASIKSEDTINFTGGINIGKLGGFCFDIENITMVLKKESRENRAIKIAINNEDGVYVETKKFEDDIIVSFKR